MYRDMTASDLLEWEALYAIDPWGEQRADLRAGIIASATVAPHCRKHQMPKPADFMPFCGKRTPRQQTVAEIKAIAEEVKRTWKR
jgi:hypothetical protein